MDRFYNGWEELFASQFSQPYFVALKQFVTEKYSSGVVFPPKSKIFHAFDITSPDDVKVVILGQDPYINDNQAMGLAFSVPSGQLLPMSLQNIFREIKDDLGYKPQLNGGDLTPWAEQGVLLMNSVLTVDKGQSNSHANKGWEKFTDSVIKYLNCREKPIVFMLWGNYAISKARLITNRQHLVLKAPHPSPLSAYRGFLGCSHFSQANEYMAKYNAEIRW